MLNWVFVLLICDWIIKHQSVDKYKPTFPWYWYWAQSPLIHTHSNERNYNVRSLALSRMQACTLFPLHSSGPCWQVKSQADPLSVNYVVCTHNDKWIIDNSINNSIWYSNDNSNDNSMYPKSKGGEYSSKVRLTNHHHTQKHCLIVMSCLSSSNREK